jgi:hypothetical protein
MNYEVKNVTAYHVTQNSFDINDIIKNESRVFSNEKECTEIQFECLKPDGLGSRADAFFVCRYEDIEAWAHELFCYHGNMKKQYEYNVLKLELDGKLFWADIAPHDNYESYSKLLGEKNLEKEKCAIRYYWSSVIDNDDFNEKSIGSKESYEGLFWGKAKIVKIEVRKGG